MVSKDVVAAFDALRVPDANYPEGAIPEPLVVIFEAVVGYFASIAQSLEVIAECARRAHPDKGWKGD